MRTKITNIVCSNCDLLPAKKWVKVKGKQNIRLPLCKYCAEKKGGE